MKESGIYTEEEMVKFVLDLPNHKIADLEDALDPEEYALIRALQQDPSQTYYLRYDTLDEEDYEYCTLQEAKDWLSSFWYNNPDDDQSDEDLEQLEREIMASDLAELHDRLGGVAYAIDVIEYDEQQFLNNPLEEIKYVNLDESN
ncbi:hypothetical protein ACPA0F_18345 [Solibacillus silvestris]